MTRAVAAWAWPVGVSVTYVTFVLCISDIVRSNLYLSECMRVEIEEKNREILHPVCFNRATYFLNWTAHCFSRLCNFGCILVLLERKCQMSEIKLGVCSSRNIIGLSGFDFRARTFT